MSNLEKLENQKKLLKVLETLKSVGIPILNISELKRSIKKLENKLKNSYWYEKKRIPYNYNKVGI